MNLGLPYSYARILTNSPAVPKPALQATNLVAGDRRAIMEYPLSRQCADLLIIPLCPIVQRNGQSRYSGLEPNFLAYGMAIVQQLSCRGMP